MIDLHSHTDESDGTYSPIELLGAAIDAGLRTLAITDHDTLAGYDKALPHAAEAGIELICGIEVSTRFRRKSVHLLGYFLRVAPSDEFREWILGLQTSRELRNHKLIEKLRDVGVDITMDEVRKYGARLVGRPHFACVLVDKGYVESIQQAFDLYLDESAKCSVQRPEPPIEEAIRQILNSGGVPVLPHPCRLSGNSTLLDEYVAELKGFGLRGLEVYHSDHSPEEIELYQCLAQKYGLIRSGGSDFHGMTKPAIALGTGKGFNLNVPESVLTDLRSVA